MSSLLDHFEIGEIEVFVDSTPSLAIVPQAIYGESGSKWRHCDAMCNQNIDENYVEKRI